MADSKAARVIIAFICAYALVGSYAFHTLPLSSPTPPSWYHHPAIVIPGVILTLPAILFIMLLGNLIPRDGGALDHSLSNLLSTIDPYVTILWCIVLFFLLNRAVRSIERRRAGHRTQARVTKAG